METYENYLTDEELRGSMTLKLYSGKNLEEFCKKHFSSYDPVRFEIVALRVYYGKEIILTLYARDLLSSEPQDEHSIPVRKFKTGVFSLAELMNFVDEFNFTVSAGHHSLENMKVTNK